MDKSPIEREPIPNPGEALELTLAAQEVLVFRCTGPGSAVELK